MPPSADEGPPVWRATWAGGLATDVSGRSHTIRVDEPESEGGADTGPMPTELLTAALASCMCVAVVWAAGKRRVELADDLAVEVTPTRVPGQPRYDAYAVTVRCSTPADVLDPIVALAERYCWVTNTLRQSPKITVRAEGGTAGA